MIDIKLTSGDLTLTDGDLGLIAGAEAVKQAIETRLKTFYGEWFLDPEGGVKYFQVILKKNPYRPVVETELRKAILQTPGVARLEYFNLAREPSTRATRVEFRAISSEGVVSGEVKFL